VRLHARIGEALEDLYGDQVEAHAPELAYHYGEAEAVVGPDKVVRYCLLAGEKALASYAYEEAQDYFQRGLQAKEGQPMDRETAELHHGMGRALGAVLERIQAQTAVDHLRAAFDYYLESGDARRAVEVALSPFPPIHGPTGLAEMAERALELVPEDSVEAGYLLARFGLFTWFAYRQEAAEQAFERALKIAHLHHDQALELCVLSNWGHMGRGHAEPQTRLDTYLRVLELAQQTGAEAEEEWAFEGLATYWAHEGDHVTAAHYADLAVAAADRQHARHHRSAALTVAAQIQWLGGHWDAARAFYERGLEQDPNEFRLLDVAISVERQTGDAERLKTYVDRIEEVVQGGNLAPSFQAATAAILASLDPLVGSTVPSELAQEIAYRLLEDESVLPIVQYYASLALAQLALLRKDAEAAQRHLDVLEGLGQEASFAQVGAGAAAGQLIANLLAFSGRLGEAISRLSGLHDLCRQKGYRPWQATSCHDLALWLLRRKADGDREKAMELLDEGLAIAQELGMKPLIERILAQREILKA
jgi:tetratricopeptide (TPR) repeat protein